MFDGIRESEEVKYHEDNKNNYTTNTNQCQTHTIIAKNSDHSSFSTVAYLYVCSVTCILPGTLPLSVRLATFTVFPKRQ